MASGPLDSNGALRGVLLSIHLTSNRPDEFRLFLDRLEQSTDDARRVEVVVKIDDTDERMNALLAAESKRRPFRITCISTPSPDGFYGLWRCYDELLRISDPHAYFVVGLNDEMYFTEKGWDARLQNYVGLYPDHIYRLRTSIHRERNSYDYWEAVGAGDLSPIITRRWLDLTGGWCPCNGPDSFQNAVAFYFGWLYRHETFNRPYRERVVHDIEFGGAGANRGLTDPEALRSRTAGALSAWFRLVSYPMQQEAARRAQILHAHIAAARQALTDYEVVDNPQRLSISIVDRKRRTSVWRASYRISRRRIAWTNVIRRFNYPYYAGRGDPSGQQTWSQVGYYFLTRHQRLAASASQMVYMAKKLAASVLPASFKQQYAESYLRDAATSLSHNHWDLARESFRRARAIWPGCAAGWLADGRERLSALEHQVAAARCGALSGPAHPAGAPPLQRLAEHLSARSRESCANALRFPPDTAERLRTAWLHYTLEQPFNLWTLLPPMGIRRVALLGGEGWGLALYRQLEPAGVTCVAVIQNDPLVRRAALVPAPYFSLSEYLANGPGADAVLATTRGDHDRETLSELQETLGSAVPIVSWKMLFSLLAEGDSTIESSESLKPEV